VAVKVPMLSFALPSRLVVQSFLGTLQRWCRKRDCPRWFCLIYLIWHQGNIRQFLGNFFRKSRNYNIELQFMRF